MDLINPGSIPDCFKCGETDYENRFFHIQSQKFLESEFEDTPFRLCDNCRQKVALAVLYKSVVEAIGSPAYSWRLKLYPSK